MQSNFLRQFGDANPNSIESSYYERTINATYSNDADHIHGDYHVYSLFYGMSNVLTTNSRMFIRVQVYFPFDKRVLSTEMILENHANISGIWIYLLYLVDVVLNLLYQYVILS